MQIPKKLLDKWESLRYREDAQKLADMAECHINTIYKAFDGSCSPKVFEVIAEFYAQREDVLNQYAE